MSGNNSEKLNEIDKCLGKTGPIRNKNLHHSPQKKQKDVKDHSIKNRLCPDVFTGNCYQTIREKMVLTYIVLHHGEWRKTCSFFYETRITLTHKLGKDNTKNGKFRPILFLNVWNSQCVSEQNSTLHWEK